MKRRAETNAPRAARGDRRKMPDPDDREKKLLELVHLIQMDFPDAAKLDMSQLENVSERQMHFLASAFERSHGRVTALVLAVFAAERLIAEDLECGIFWFRVLQALANFEQTEPDPGRMSH